ncbi:zinc finger protein 425-like [Daktulosphaira vitifoliae]|uniref:zinc finger protein 425-like n=1 Tax=Daktulosphaira vitifoliae TaxID=58002 RepID=UPI0021AAB3FF|nr:zinc finger protein 425-like [Daktulosphaira vitifoliae]XP_050537270.1 zinc finger protein 425-like [Daktulosphaira vitifoliae]
MNGHVLELTNANSYEELSFDNKEHMSLINTIYQDKVMIKESMTYSSESIQFDSETEETYDECYSCFMCNVSYNTQFDLEEHLRTHNDDETFHHSNIDSTSEPLPSEFIRPSKYFRCYECLKVCKSQLSYNEHMLTHTGEKPHHCRVCDRKFRHIANFRTHLKSHTNIKTLVCSLCCKTIVGEKNYYIHYMDVHNKMSVRQSRLYHTSSSDSDEDFNPKISYYKKKKINMRNGKCRKYNEPFGPLFAKKAWEKKQFENYIWDIDEEKCERDAVHEAIECSRLDIQNMLKNKKQQLNDYNTEEYQKLLDILVEEKNSTGKINEAKLIGPFFWKSALCKAGLIEEYLSPVQFQSQLRVTECISCRKCFARLPQNNKDNIIPSTPPCSSCFMMKNETTLNKHKSEQHTENPPYICKECLSQSYSWYEYVQHMKMHLRYAARCSECIYMMMNKPEQVIFLCHECDMSFDSDEQLKIHLKTHLENGQNNSCSNKS